MNSREWHESVEANMPLEEPKASMALIYPCASTICVRTSEDIARCELFMLQREPFLKGPMIGGGQESQMTQGVKEAKKNGVRYLAVVEHDQRFPPDAFVRLRAHKKPIIGAGYRQRNRRTWTTIKGDGPMHSRGKTGIEEVDTIGLGVTLIDMKVFDVLPEPWFLRTWIPEADRHSTPDVYFGRLAKAHGFSSWVDHDLSKEVAHISQVELWPDRVVFTETGEMFCGIPEGFDK